MSDRSTVTRKLAVKSARRNGDADSFLRTRYGFACTPDSRYFSLVTTGVRSCV